jgi:hypothetical protein
MTNPPLAKYHFYPVFRRGAAADIPASSADPLSRALSAARVAPAIKLGVAASGPPMPSLQDLSGGPVDKNGNPALFLYGPGDIIGFDTRHVTLTEPKDGTLNFEPNYFAGIEFDDPDMSWMFTPAQATATSAGVAQARLRPWLVLVVLADGEYQLTAASTSPGLDTITLSNSPQVLPDLDDSWAWAHTQLSGDLNGDQLDDLVVNQPQRFTSRILCQRALRPDTHYTAFLVPAFDIGAKAGLTPPSADNPGPTTAPKPAWKAGDTGVQLPVYLFLFVCHERQRGFSVARAATGAAGDLGRGIKADRGG